MFFVLKKKKIITMIIMIYYISCSKEQIVEEAIDMESASVFEFEFEFESESESEFEFEFDDNFDIKDLNRSALATLDRSLKEEELVTKEDWVQTTEP